MQFVFQYPEVSGRSFNMMAAGKVADLAVLAEESGWSGIAFTEHPAPSVRWLEAGGHQSLDPLVALAHVAAATRRIRLLTYLTVLPYRNPALLAKAAATADILSDGRLILGVGAGYLKSEFFALGVDFEQRNRRLDEALDVLPRHWSGEPFDYTGTDFSCRGIIGLPRPVQQPIPIWIGGNSARSLRRVAERAQGWMPLSGSPGLFATVRTPAITAAEEIVGPLARLRELAGDRFTELDIALMYHDDSIYDERLDAPRHRDAFARLSEIGVTWLIVQGPAQAAPAGARVIERIANLFEGAS